jgi:hypothetical protein
VLHEEKLKQEAAVLFYSLSEQGGGWDVTLPVIICMVATVRAPTEHCYMLASS